MEREPLHRAQRKDGGKSTVIPILDDPKPEPKAVVQEPMPISIDNVNGQLTELVDINQMLTARLTKQRGLMADMQRQLRDQTMVITTQAKRITELEAKTVLRKQNGHR